MRLDDRHLGDPYRHVPAPLHAFGFKRFIAAALRPIRRPHRPRTLLVAATAVALLGCASQEILEPAGVRYLEVAASDYKLELQPVFDPAVTSYSALADGPGIEVYVDVFVDREVDAVLVNDVPAAISGYRTWRSVPETDLVAPVTAVVEVVDGTEEPAQYEISILVP